MECCIISKAIMTIKYLICVPEYHECRSRVIIYLISMFLYIFSGAGTLTARDGTLPIKIFPLKLRNIEKRILIHWQ